MKDYSNRLSAPLTRNFTLPSPGMPVRNSIAPTPVAIGTPGIGWLPVVVCASVASGYPFDPEPAGSWATKSLADLATTNHTQVHPLPFCEL